jgi:preprotein translocase subunit SecE
MLEGLRNSARLTVNELLYKVTWPSWEELQQSAIVVLIASLLIALVVFLMDTAFRNVFDVFYEIFQ